MPQSGHVEGCARRRLCTSSDRASHVVAKRRGKGRVRLATPVTRTGHASQQSRTMVTRLGTAISRPSLSLSSLSFFAVILSGHARGALLCCHPERSEGPHETLGDGSPRQSWGLSAAARLGVLQPLRGFRMTVCGGLLEVRLCVKVRRRRCGAQAPSRDRRALSLHCRQERVRGVIGRCQRNGTRDTDERHGPETRPGTDSDMAIRESSWSNASSVRHARRMRPMRTGHTA
jgi:hypothetical protein